jgi:hypothetical protein
MMSVDDAERLRHLWRMTTTKLDLTRLKYPLPALMTRKALKTLQPRCCHNLGAPAGSGPIDAFFAPQQSSEAADIATFCLSTSA